jgi:steroid delta-isomerase-like uncharacterized protein
VFQQIGATPTPGKDSGESMTIETNKAILVRYFNEVLNQGHLEVIDEIYTNDYKLDAPIRSDGSSLARGITQGREQLKQRILLFRTGFPDIHFNMDEIIGEKDTVVVRYTYRGTHLGLFAGVEPSGCSISIPGILVAHLIAGKIHEALSAFDSAELMKQLSC